MESDRVVDQFILQHHSKNDDRYGSQSHYAHTCTVSTFCLSQSPRQRRSTDANYRFSKDEMQRELLEQMYRQTELDDLLKESDYTIRRRKECMQMVESLSRASEIVSQVQ